MLKVLLTALLVIANGTGMAQDGHEHHGHQGHGAVPPMDADGRRLDPEAPRHEMSDEQLAALREKIALYRALTDTEARLNMALMGPNYEWYVSDPALQSDTGVLILSHGVGENSDRLFVEKLKPLAEQRPTAVSFGMAMMMSSQLQSAVDDLTERGAERIVLVPTSMSEHNSLTRQWKYIFSMHDEASYLEVPRVESDATFMMANHLEDHPLVTEILLDHTLEKSKNPQNEVVILVGHGPEEIEDNVPDMVVMQTHADRIKAQTDFADVKAINLQDDAFPPIRKSNVKKLQRWVTAAKRRGQTVIVTVTATASFGFQEHVREDLRGYDYVFVDKGLNEHPKYLRWVEAAVEERLSLADAG
ncbi:MAG: hypothetical protein KJP03_07260 [Gammaproteobacteria bacterium]|nr:hypothetical protein [Gammaproteobacteria bacterium]